MLVANALTALMLAVQGPPGGTELQGALRERIDDGGPIPVVFWLDLGTDAPDLRAVLDRALARGARGEDARREALAVAAAGVEAVQRPFVQALRERGLAVDYADPFVPIVFATLPGTAIRELATRDDVALVYYVFREWYAEGAPAPNEWASPSARTDFVHRKGVTGAGVKVLVNDVSAIETANPYLPPVVSGNPAAFPGSHATAVAGVIASRHPQQTGAAPGLTALYDYSGTGDITAPQAWSWGMQQGISFGNCSWWNGSKGSIEFLDRYFDYVIRNFAVMMFKSAGNQGNGDFVTTPGNGYNVTTCGNADDRNTLDWADDALATTSSTENPIEGHEKPELGAHGSGITSTTTFLPWVGPVGSGTSFAAPVACGTAALLAETDPALTAKPEVVKAMLMAGAWHDLAGGAPLSDEIGAGLVDAAASQRAVADGQYHAIALTPSSFDGGAYAVPIPLVAHDETRVVALWLSSADPGIASDLLQVDLDLEVLDPSGVRVAGRASALDAFEIVQFVPNRTGDHIVRLTAPRFAGSYEPLAIAWTTRQDAATDTVTITGSGAPGSTVQLDFADPYHPGATYFGLMSVTPFPAILPLGPNKMLPFGFDGLTAATFAGLPGFAGTLDADGRASAILPVPPIPPITLQAAMITFRTAPSRAEETSDVVTFTIGR